MIPNLAPLVEIRKRVRFRSGFLSKFDKRQQKAKPQQPFHRAHSEYAISTPVLHLEGSCRNIGVFSLSAWHGVCRLSLSIKQLLPHIRLSHTPFEFAKIFAAYRHGGAERFPRLGHRSGIRGVAHRATTQDLGY